MNAERVYTVLVEPRFTEKAAVRGEESNQYVFRVAVDATKAEIKEAVETLFKVDVTTVSTLNVKGKTRRTVRGVSKGKSWKKAYVRVAEGQDIDYAVAE